MTPRSVEISSFFPLTVTTDDLYIPEYAAEIVELVETSTLERDYAMIHALAVYAEMKLRGVRLN